MIPAVNSLNDNVVWSIYKDKEDILWIGTYKGGINRIDTKSNNFSSFTKLTGNNSISSNHIRVIKEDKYGNLLGSYDHHNLINKKNKQVKIYNHSPRDIKSIGANQIQFNRIR